MTYFDLLEYWKRGFRITYQYLTYSQALGAHDPTKEDNLKELFYRQGVKFKVHK